MCLASVILVVGTNSVIAFTFCFIGEIPFPDTKCPRYLISILKNFHLDILIWSQFLKKFQRLIVYVLGVLLQF